MSTFEEDSALSFIKSFRKIPRDWFVGTIWEQLSTASEWMTDEELSKAICDVSNYGGMTLNEKYTA